MYYKPIFFIINIKQTMKAEKKTPSYLKKSSKDFDYLLSMPLWNLTMEKVNKLKSERDEKQRQVRELEATPPENIW